jgi:hypothetical protein
MALQSGISAYGGRAGGPAEGRQINPNHGLLPTYDPIGNARAGIIISGNGTSWHPWTTFLTGAYRGGASAPRRPGSPAAGPGGIPAASMPETGTGASRMPYAEDRPS